MGLKGCFFGTHEDPPNSRLGDIHSSEGLLSCTLVWSLTVTTSVGLGRWKEPPSQLAPWAWVGSGSFTASALTVGVLTPIQEDQGTPGEVGDMAENLRVLLAVGLS